MTEPVSMGDAPRDVRITTNGVTAAVAVDGTDLSKALSGYQIDHRAGQMPFLVLFARPGNDGVAFEGMAQVAVATETPPGEAIAAFLAGIDPTTLENKALNRGDLGNERGDLTRAMLAQLTDWALGRGA